MPPAMIPKRVITSIEALRKAMTDAEAADDDSFGKVFHQFFDLAEDQAFIEAGKRAKDPVLRGALDHGTRRFMRDEGVTLQRLMMLRIAPLGFVHGGFFATPYIASFFYFEREKQGIIAYQGDGTTDLVRITLAVLPPGTMPVKRTPGVQ